MKMPQNKIKKKVNSNVIFAKTRMSNIIWIYIIWRPKYLDTTPVCAYLTFNFKTIGINGYLTQIRLVLVISIGGCSYVVFGQQLLTGLTTTK